MKLNGKMMVAVAMMLGALGAVGCNRADAQDAAPEGAAPQPVAQATPAPAAAPAAKSDASTIQASTTTTTTPGVEQDSVRFGVFVPLAPPAVRFERPGRAPSARHFWVNGYWRYDRGHYNWIGGHWDVRRGGYTFVQAHYDLINGRVRYIPGHWVRL